MSKPIKELTFSDHRGRAYSYFAVLPSEVKLFQEYIYDDKYWFLEIRGNRHTIISCNPCNQSMKQQANDTIATLRAQILK